MIPTHPNTGGRRYVRIASKGNGCIPRLVGVEIELATITTGPSFDNFSRKLRVMGCEFVADGSLPSGGTELVTTPWAGKDFEKNIGWICENLCVVNAGVTSACGLHNHVDARDFTPYDLRRLIVLWATIEPVMLRLIPERRWRDSTTCKPNRFGMLADVLNVQHSPVITRHLLYYMLYGNVTGMQEKAHKYASVRYFAMNLHSWNLRGTIEFRLPPGTVDYDVMWNWAALFSQIVEYAKRTPERRLFPWNLVSNEQKFIALFTAMLSEEVRAAFHIEGKVKEVVADGY
jgi:hypothetical protein